MIDRKDFVIIILVCFLLAVALYPSITASQNSMASMGGYNPWVDYNDDGKINYLDLYSLAKAYGTTGDPTKDVRVTNWPVSTEVNVWWAEHIGPNDVKYSSTFNASGFGHLHVFGNVGLDLVGELGLIISAKLWNANHTGWREVRVYSVALTSAYPYANITIPVPSEEFFFVTYCNSTSEGYVYLSFYLTWA